MRLIAEYWPWVFSVTLSSAGPRLRQNQPCWPSNAACRVPLTPTKATERLAKIVAKYGATLSLVYFTVDAGAIAKHAAGDPYELSIVLMYPPGKDPDATGEIADQAATEVDTALRSCFAKDKLIALNSCFAMSEDDLPVSKARDLQQWRLEHMTFRATETQPAPLAK